MNFRDPCKNISIPSHVLIPNDIQSPMRRRYDVENLQTLGICPKDDKKMAAIGLVSITAILCWIIMDIGSRVMKMHLMDEAQRGIRQSLLKYEPDPVNAITDLSSRKESDIPRAELRPLSFSPVVWDRIKDFAKLHRKSVRDSAGFPCAAICNPLTSDNTFTPIGGKFGSITSTSFQRPTGYGTQIKNSIMILAPKMVIRPPAVDEKEGRNSLWFNRTD
ncbi:uncharacterized protein LOC118434023 [Folsomia candida]|nr:uncharacterized protein LOC118434023 [Folsomia candida]